MMPELVPVDHDPFESGAGPSFSPVEHDPFADIPIEKSVPERGLFRGTSAEELATQPHDTSIYGTAIPKRAGTPFNFGASEPQMPYETEEQYGARTPNAEALKGKFGEAIGRIKETAKNLYESYDPKKGPGVPLARPLSTFTPFVGKLSQLASEALSAAASPVTSAVYPPLEKYTAIPGEDIAGAARATSALEQASPEAVRILEGVARDEGWTEHTLDQLEGGQSPHHFLAESSENMEQLAKANQTLPGAARTETNQAVSQRHRERGERVNAIHDEYLGQDVDRTTWDAAMKAAAKQESAPFWQQFDRQVITPTPEIEAVLQRPGMRRALAAANDTLLNRGMPIEQGVPFLGEEEAAGFGDNARRTAAERGAARTKVPAARAFQLAKMQLD